MMAARDCQSARALAVNAAESKVPLSKSRSGFWIAMVAVMGGSSLSITDSAGWSAGRLIRGLREMSIRRRLGRAQMKAVQINRQVKTTVQTSGCRARTMVAQSRNKI